MIMINTLVFAGIVLSLVQILKMAFNIASNYIPLVSLAVGVAIFALAYYTSPGMVITWNGLSQILVAVLSAMGIYSGTKATVGN